MFFGLFGVFFLSFIEGKIYKKVNEEENRNFVSFLLIFISFFSLLIIAFFYGIDVHSFDYLKNKWFYIIILTESLGSYLYREAYYHNKEKYTIVNMFMFSTVYLTPIFAYFMNTITGLDNKLNTITSLELALTYSLLLFIGSVFYFKGKIKDREIKKPIILILLATNMLFNMYLGIKMAQTYNPFLIFASLLLFVSLMFLFIAYKKKEKLYITKNKIKEFKYIFSIKSVFHLIYVQSIAFVPVELIAIVRRMSQLFSGLIIDKKIPKSSEAFGILIIVLTFILMIYNYY